MKRWQWYVCGVLCGLALAGSLGVARLGMETSAAADVAASTSLAMAATAAEKTPPEDGKLRIIAFGAHPDDCEVYAGGTACLWSDLGHHVKFVSATNGDIGHWQTAGGPLAQRRTAEVQEAARIMGNAVQVLDIHDGEIEPTLENRRTFTRLIRHWNADVVISHRPNDYHPDHRYTGILVQDAGYMVTVPFFCPDVPAIRKNPVFLYASDGFQKPNPFRPDIVVSIDSVIERKMDAMAKLVSQFIEGGCGGSTGDLPRDQADLKARQEQMRAGWLRQQHVDIANQYRDKLIELYGEEAGKKIRHAEAFEICEYGRRPTQDELRILFPFVPEKK
ncbi:MAG: PIG-L family deacetylase [Planctomycetota bacterium]